MTDNPGDITVEVNAPASQLLVVSESFHDGWRATIDGSPVEVERVNGDFLGAVVPAGGTLSEPSVPALSFVEWVRYVSVFGSVFGLAFLWMGPKGPETVDRRLEPNPMRFLTFGQWLALGGVLMLVAGPLGTRLGVSSFLVGFALLALGALSILLSVLALVAGGFRTGEWMRALPLIAVGVAVLAVPVFIVLRAGGGAADSRHHHGHHRPAAVRVGAARCARRPTRRTHRSTAVRTWRRSSGARFPTSSPWSLPVPPQQAFDRALAQVHEFGWEVSGSAPAEGRIEAVDTTFFFGFKDDVVIRLRPTEGGTRVDVRSKSRVGVGDLGANAARIRRLLAALRDGS